MPEDARAIANFLLSLAWSRGLEVSHLQLQKILFFAHAWHLGKYGEPLIGQPFEAWQYGPVVRVVYDQLKRFRSDSVREKLTKIDVQTGGVIEARASFSEEKTQFLIDLFEYYHSFHPYNLVDLTHERDGPWDKVWRKAGDGAVAGMAIPNESIKLWILRAGGNGVRPL
ncbi:DUF4065 domain-containing protein [Rhizobium grahamii]|uniref:DUF4065 domain-containing protein n=1 Tax=Rhizobium grahamii TaxID=1120045 RepID=A0A5Q0C356_9HYPH|nr:MULTISPECIES: type II toxin-antitoxin system antitoxin SocA domain-containing protein [Rhizobium]QFY59873.1 DUF4065 domain-containing protein [Rhizobium grahamii]QRM51010.1 DUF4065 domain-containing protein [Rhizobium sp. BG6]